MLVLGGRRGNDCQRGCRAGIRGFGSFVVRNDREGHVWYNSKGCPFQNSKSLEEQV